MGVGVVVGMVKMKMVVMGLKSSTPPRAVMLAGLLVPLAVKALMKMKVVQLRYWEVMDESRLLFFQLGQIASSSSSSSATSHSNENENENGNGNFSSSVSRFARAFYLLYHRLTLLPSATASDEAHHQDSFNTLSMVAL